MSNRSRKRQPRVSPLRRLFVGVMSGFGVFALLGFLALATGLWTYQGPGPAAKSGEQTTVDLRKGASLQEVASTLKRAKVIGSSSVFAAAAQLTGSARQLKAGEYQFPSHASMAQVLATIRDGKTVSHRITVAEGLTSEMVAEIVAREPLLTGVAPTPAEGTILPETYQFERGEDRAKVLARMVDAQDKLLAVLWEHRQPGLPLLSPEQAVTLASIVEKETGKATERPQVAAVFINRLRLGMRLQSDPTVIYGVSRGRPLGRGLRMSELTAASIYNTYQIDGLPPGAIANPGREALAAVLDPPRSDDLYFVADGTGGHVFAATLDDHNRNVEHWRVIEAQRAKAAKVGK